MIKIQVLLSAYVFSFMFRVKVRVNPNMILFFSHYPRIVCLHMLPPLFCPVLTMYSGSNFFHMWIKYYL